MTEQQNEKIWIAFERVGSGIKCSLESTRDLALLDKGELTALEAVAIRCYVETGKVLNAIIGPVLAAHAGGKKND